MLKSMKVVGFILLVTTLGFFYGILNRQYLIPYVYFISEGKILKGIMLMTNGFKSIHGFPNNSEVSSTYENLLLVTTNAPSSTMEIPALKSSSEILKEGDGIVFLETSDRMELPPLVLCAVESAARVYKNRPVAFFLKGLNDTNNEELVRRLFPTLSALSNIYFFPLKLEDVFTETPLHAWYMKINPQQQNHWIHVSSDGCRLALIWKYGGIYLDTDVISIRTIPKQDFLAAESSRYSSNGIFGFSPHHNFTQKCMEDFVLRYNSKIWGNQGPHLFTRVLQKFCDASMVNATADTMCGNITIFNPQRFYPISYPSWRRYYQVWNEIPTFNNSYALHLWNYMNRANVTVVPGSNVLAEHLYKKYCPSTYEHILRNATTFH